MIWGLLLIFVGVELNLVNSVVLTPRASRFWESRLSASPFEDGLGGTASSGSPFSRASQRTAYGQSFSDQYGARNNFPFSTPSSRSYRNGSPFGNSNFRSAGYDSSAVVGTVSTEFGDQKMITPPSWYCWPPIFLGAVLFLFGAARSD